MEVEGQNNPSQPLEPTTEAHTLQPAHPSRIDSTHLISVSPQNPLARLILSTYMRGSYGPQEPQITAAKSNTQPLMSKIGLLFGFKGDHMFSFLEINSI